MNDLSAQDILELEVEDFGPIVKAKIDLRPLTVFVGPSNTGKSYLAILIYALHQYFSGHRWPSYWMFEGDEIRKVPQETIDILLEWAQQTFADKDKLRVEKSIVLPFPIVDVIHSSFNMLGNHLDDEIGRCFGIGKAGALIRKGSRDGVRIGFWRRFSDNLASFEHGFTIRAQETEFRTTIHEKAPMQLDTGVMHAHSVVVSSLIGSAPMAGLRPAMRTPMLSGVLADFLEQLIELDHPSYLQRKTQWIELKRFKTSGQVSRASRVSPRD